jgi:hypothetical protein
MRERPILFQPELVRRIREGRKIETRRLVKPQPRRGLLGDGTPIIRCGDDQLGPLYHVWEPRPAKTKRSGAPWLPHGIIPLTEGCRYRWMEHCPYGHPGDRLWIRSTWATAANLDDKSPSRIGQMAVEAGFDGPWAPVWFKAGGYNNAVSEADAKRDWGGQGKWRPSIHMPRWACRDLVQVESVRMEPLQEIDADAIVCEGIADFTGYETVDELRAMWVELWDSINGDRAAWSANPWVWVVRFKRVDP